MAGSREVLLAIKWTFLCQRIWQEMLGVSEPPQDFHLLPLNVQMWEEEDFVSLSHLQYC